MTDGWIVIPNWDKFQHYKNRGPVWIKLYTELRDRDEWRHLTLAARGLLASIWIEYAARDCQATYLRRTCGNRPESPQTYLGFVTGSGIDRGFC